MRRRDLNVVDGTTPLVLKVTQKDIDKATQADAGSCAIAQCLLRHKGVVDVRIGASTAFVDYTDRVERYVIETADRQRLAVFDRDGYFAPGTYTLQPPPPGRQIGDRVGMASGSNTRKGKARNVDRAQPLRGRVSAGQFLV